jgi:hypothetical protein
MRRGPIVVLGVAVALVIVVGAGLLVRHQRAEHRRREQAREQMNLLLGTEGHRRHAGLVDVDCASCHQGGRPAAQTCAPTCHKPDHRLHPQHPDADSCVSCHRFSLPKQGEKPGTVAECARCHAGSDTTKKAVTSDSLHGRVDCKLCHEPHGTIDAAAARDCARCHDLGKDPLSGPEGHRVCKECHEEHGSKAAALASCARCHQKNATGMAMTKVAGHMASLVPPGAQPPTAALAHASCASCHLPHDWKAEISGCARCHEKEAVLVREKSPAPHAQCTTCHDAHETSRASAACARCHKAEAEHRGLAPARHKDCSACHDPHASSGKAAREACASCHGAERTQLVKWGGASHAKLGCLGCHASHGDPRSESVTCAACHGEQNNLALAAPQKKHRACESCHEPHIFSAGGDVDAACATCHGSVTGAGMIHRGECKTCHASHGSPSVTRVQCDRCHEGIRLNKPTGAAKHAVCGSCHAAHRPANVAPATCQACHQGPAAASAAWPPGSVHAKDCSGCHPAHNVNAKPPCASCHKTEAAQAVASRHKCNQCHPAHKEPPGVRAAWWKGCGSCHAAEASAVKGRGATHADCQKCHRAHGSGQAACASCHADIGGKGEHHTKEHAKCQSCHNAHASASVTRAQCLACHKNLTKHHPDAPFCQTCHSFQ